LTSPRVDTSFAQYVYAVCPNCKHRDWATERRFFGILGPKALYALVLAFMIAFLVAVAYSALFQRFG